MKKKLVNYLLSASILLILLEPVEAQVLSKYLYGMYARNYTGIYNSGTAYYGLTGLSTGKNILKVWNENLKMNLFQIHNSGNPGDIFVNYFKSSSYGINTELQNGDIRPIYDLVSGNITDFCQGNYLLFSPTTVPDNSLSLYNGSITTTVVSNNFRVRNNTGTDIVQKIVNNAVVNGTYNNALLIRSWPHNTDNYGESNMVTHYKLRIRIKNSSSNSTLLRIKIYDSTSSTTYVQTNTTISLAAQASRQEFIIPFDVTKSNCPNPFYYKFTLELYCEMEGYQYFDIESVTLYDDYGKTVVEDAALNSNSLFINSVNAILNNINSYTYPPIIALGDEAIIGNYSAQRKVVDYIRALNSNIKFYTTVTWHYKDQANSIERYLREVNQDYIAPDIYPFGETVPSTGTGYRDKISVYYNEFNDILQRAKSINPNVTAINVVQAHTWTGEHLRRPTKWELLTSSYLSMISNAKGIIYFWVGPPDYDNNTTDYGIYKPAVPFLGYGASLFTYLFNLNNIDNETGYNRRAVIDKIANFINYPIESYLNEGTNKIGDLLYDNQMLGSALLGFNGSNTISTSSIGNIGKAKLSQVEFVDFSTGVVLPSTSTNLAGVSYFEKDNSTYFLFTNLNSDGHALRVRTLLNSRHTNNLLRISTIGDNTQLNNRYYSKDCFVNFILPAEGAILLKVENYQPNESGGDFSKKMRFGIVREVSGNTKVVLDKNFYSIANQAEERELVVTGTSYQVFTLDYNGDGATDIGTFKYYNSGSNTTLEYKIYYQNSSNFSSSPSVTITKNISGNNLNLQSIAFNAGLAGIDKVGYVIRNSSTQQYSIYWIDSSNYIQSFGPSFGGTTVWSTTGQINIGRWNNVLTVFLYANNTMFIDKDHDFNLNETGEFYYMSPGYPNVAYAVWGDWSGDNNTDFGIYQYDNWIPGYDFRLNFTGTDGQSYFEFPYGMSGDKPLTWRPYEFRLGKEAAQDAVTENKSLSEFDFSVYPNPFNPTAKIDFVLSENNFVKLELFDILGRSVRILTEGQFSPGKYSYTIDGTGLSSGVYILRGTMGPKNIAKKIIIAK